VRTTPDRYEISGDLVAYPEHGERPDSVEGIKGAWRRRTEYQRKWRLHPCHCVPPMLLRIQSGSPPRALARRRVVFLISEKHRTSLIPRPSLSNHARGGVRATVALEPSPNWSAKSLAFAAARWRNCGVGQEGGTSRSSQTGSGRHGPKVANQCNARTHSTAVPAATSARRIRVTAIIT
jgi:hypothetical protein